MEISQRQAEEIVNTLKSVIQEDINFISPDGTIIASSDEKRVGSYHEGAVIVAQTMMPLIISSDDMYQGAKKGINLPLFYEQKLIAVVGITGDSNEIIQYSNVIVKMSEILIKEHFLNVQKQFKRENQRVIIELIMKDKFNSEILKLKMDELGYDTSSYHYLIICEVEHLDRYNIDVINNIFNSIEKRIGTNDLLARHESQFVYVSQLNDQHALLTQIKAMKSYIEQKYKIEVTVGISEPITTIDDYFGAYKQAKMVVELGTNKGSGLIKFYDRTSLDLLFQGFSNYLNIDFSAHVFKEMTKEEIEETKEIILTYIRNNGSIQKASEELFIHKNTLQYRLNRIHEWTGYNPRELEDMIRLYLAIQLERKE